MTADAGRPPAGLTRRRTLRLLGGGACLALGAPAVLRAETPDGLVSILARSGLGPATGFAVADAATGAILESHQPDLDRPPASVAKIVTALFALDALGPDHRFRTELRAGGAVEDGRVAGPLVLVGGGDPTLDTDRIGALAERLAAGGIRGAAGFSVDAGALPALPVTEADQPAHVGYNPAIGALNLNFNRVQLAWGPGPDGVALELRAPGERHSVPVSCVRAEVGGTGAPAHRLEGDAEIWRVPRPSLAGKGEVWLPVRRPEAYAREVFARLAGRAGIDLPAGAAPKAAPAGATRVLAARESADLGTLMREMLRHSTNLTAEVAGLAAARKGEPPPTGLAASAAAMTGWARQRWGLSRAEFANHSGLTLRSRLTAHETLAILGDAPGLAALLPERPILDRNGDVWRGAGVRAKTGTMYFLRGYAGYIEGKKRRLAFAIFAADPEARSAVDPGQSAPPAGARDWTAKARAQENALLRRWATLHGA